jgi:hypothetical protein
VAHAPLSEAGRELVLRRISSLGELRALELSAMQRMGLGIVDRRQLQEFLQAARVQGAHEPRPTEVMTEPQRLARTPCVFRAPPTPTPRPPPPPRPSSTLSAVVAEIVPQPHRLVSND